MPATNRKRGRRARWAIIFLVVLIVAGAGLWALSRLRGRAQSFYQKGQIYLRSGDTKHAMEFFNKTLEIDPSHHDAQLSKVDVYMVEGEYRKAISEIEVAERMGMPAAETALIRARLLYLQAMDELREAGAENPQAAGPSLNQELCDRVLAERVEPAIGLAAANADAAGDAALAYTLLGDLYERKRAVLAVKALLFSRDTEQARGLGRSDEAAALKAGEMAVAPLASSARAAAARAYTRALDLDPGLEPPRLKLARIALRAYVPELDLARSVLGPLVEKDVGNLTARLLLAQTERLAGRHDLALADLDAIGAGGAANPEVLLERAQILVAAERWQEADAVSKRLVEIIPAGVPAQALALYLRGKTLLELGRPAEAVEPLQQIFVLRQPGDAPAAHLALAMALEGKGSREQAISAYKRTVAAAQEFVPGSAQAARDLSDTQYGALAALARMLAKDDPEQARDFTMKAFRLQSYRPEAYEAARAVMAGPVGDLSALASLALRHASAQLLTGVPVETVLALLDGVLAEVDESPSAMALAVLRARLLARSGMYGEAADAYSQVRSTYGDKRSGRELAALWVRIGRPHDAEALYAEMLKEDPTDRSALAGLVGMRLMEGDAEGATELLASAAGAEDSTAVALMLLGVYQQEGKAKEAAALAESLAEAQPTDVRIRTRLAEMRWSDGDLAGARAVFDEALELDPDYLPAYRRGLLDLHTGDVESAVSLFRTAWERFPTSMAAGTQLAIALQAAGAPDEARALLLAMLADPQIPAAHKGILHWYLAVLEAGADSEEKALSHDAQSRFSSLGSLADRQDLLRSLRSLPADRRSEAAVALSLTTAFNRAGLREATTDALNRVLGLLPDEPLPMCWHANVLDGSGQPEQAVAEYNALIEKHPEMVYVRAMLAETLLRQGEVAEAVAALTKALPHAGEAERAALQFRLGPLHERLGQVEAALACYRAAMVDGAVAPAACNNMAYLLATEAGEPERALPIAEQALKLGGPHPTFLDTLGWVQSLNGNHAEALRYLQEAKRGMPEDPRIRYHLAVVLHKLGRDGEARGELQESLALPGSFPESGEAEELLGSL